MRIIPQGRFEKAEADKVRNVLTRKVPDFNLDARKTKANVVDDLVEHFLARQRKGLEARKKAR